MPRRQVLIHAAGLVCGLLTIGAALLLTASAARAETLVFLVWTGTTGAGTVGSDTIRAKQGVRLTAELHLDADFAGVSGHSVSVEFDTDLADELNLVSATAVTPAPAAAPRAL